MQKVMRSLGAAAAIGMIVGCTTANKGSVAENGRGAQQRGIASATQAGTFSVPKKTAAWLLNAMSENGKFEEGQGIPGTAYNGFVHCNNSYSDPGNHASGTPECTLMAKKDAGAQSISVPARSAAWISSTMDQNGDFEEGTDGIPGTSYTGYLRCGQFYTSPGNHASGVPYCELSTKK